MSESYLERTMREYRHEPHDNYYIGDGYREEMMCRYCSAICRLDLEDNRITFFVRRMNCGVRVRFGCAEEKAKLLCSRVRSMI